MSNLSNISDHTCVCQHSSVTGEQQVRHVFWKTNTHESRIEVPETQNAEGGDFRFGGSVV